MFTTQNEYLELYLQNKNSFQNYYVRISNDSFWMSSEFYCSNLKTVQNLENP